MLRAYTGELDFPPPRMPSAAIRCDTRRAGGPPLLHLVATVRCSRSRLKARLRRCCAACTIRDRGGRPGRLYSSGMTVREDHIRDKLAAELALIEDHLSLIRTNYPLPNSEGASGRIDILARDRHGVLVVVELKRSNKTAREA